MFYLTWYPTIAILAGWLTIPLWCGCHYHFILKTAYDIFVESSLSDGFDDRLLEDYQKAIGGNSQN